MTLRPDTARRLRVGMLVVLGGLLVLAPRAQAVLCKTRSGAINERPTCKRKETLLDLTQLGPVGLKGDPGPKGQAGPPGAGAPRMFLADATGRRLPGTVVTPRNIIFTVGSGAASTIFTASGFSDFVGLYFELPYCQGTAYMPPGVAPDNFGRVALWLGSALVYPGDPLEQHVFQSALITSSPAACTAPSFYLPAFRACCSPRSDSFAAGPRTEIDLGPWTPPLHVELEP